MRDSTTWKYALAASRRATRHTSRVVWEVTLGLPSRSPPIQLPNLYKCGRHSP